MMILWLLLGWFWSLFNGLMFWVSWSLCIGFGWCMLMLLGGRVILLVLV